MTWLIGGLCIFVAATLLVIAGAVWYLGWAGSGDESADTGPASQARIVRAEGELR